MKSAKEQVIEFIQKQYDKEKEKWNSGLKSNYYEWEEIIGEILTSKARDGYLEDLKKELRVITNYLKATGQEKDFEEWRKKYATIDK